MREKFGKAKIANSRMEILGKTYGLLPTLVYQFQITNVQSVSLCGAEIWWRNQKTYQKELHKRINQQIC